jgi:hypothetical protein
MTLETTLIKPSKVVPKYKINTVKSVNFLSNHYNKVFSNDSFYNKLNRLDTSLLPLDSISIEVLCLNCYDNIIMS